MINLINDVLDMTHIESGRMALDEKLCSIPTLLRNLQNIMLADVKEKQLDMSFNAVGLVHEDIYCDKVRLNQVLLNLLSNAVKYTDVGGTVSLRVQELPGAPQGYAHYEFSIKDNGIGMSAEFLPHLFDPFERERNTTLSGIQGTGLGMTITKNIINRMNGTIEVQSEPGVGTEFIISLSFKTHGVVDSMNAETAKSSTSLIPAHILLVEDNELNQEIALALLEDAGFTADVADNGRVAVDMLKASTPGQYSLVLMDIQMPVMNGYEAMKAIRELDREDLSQIPIFAVTANAFEEDKQRALQCGANGHIMKPIDVDVLLGTIYNVLK